MNPAIVMMFVVVAVFLGFSIVAGKVKPDPPKKETRKSNVNDAPFWSHQFLNITNTRLNTQPIISPPESKASPKA